MVPFCWARGRCAKAAKPPALMSNIRGRLALHLIHLQVLQSIIIGALELRA